MHINIITTLNCNFKCKHCIFECPSGKNLSLNLFKKTIEKFLKYDLKSITFTGGEAILNPKLDMMIDVATKNNIKFGIVSNAWLYKEYLPFVQKHRKLFSGFNFSLDGMEKKHDFIRKKGSFKRVVEAVYFYRLIGINVSINYVLSAYNYDELEQIVKLCKDLNVNSLKLAGIIPTKSNKTLLLDFKKRKKAYDYVSDLRKKYNLKIDIANSLLNPVNKLDFCPVITNIGFTLNNKGELIFCCDIPGSCSKVGMPSNNAETLLKKRIDISTKIREERIDKINKNKLKIEDQSCYYCHKFFGIIKE